MRGIFKTLLLAALAVFMSSCAGPFAEKFDAALKARNFEEAYGILNDVCPKNPGESICRERDAVRMGLANDRFLKLKAGLDAEKRPLSLPRLAALKKDAEAVKSLYASPDSSAFLELIAKETDASKAGLEASLKDAVDANAAGDRKKAFGLYMSALGIDPSIKKTVDDFVKDAVEAIYAKAAKAEGKEDWREARALLEEASYMSPDYNGLKGRLAGAVEKDSLDYYVKAASAAVKESDFDRAVKMYVYALSYKKDDPDLAAREAQARASAIAAYFSQAVDMMDNERPLSGASAVLKAKTHMEAMTEDQRGNVVAPSAAIARLLKELHVKGVNEAKAGNAEMAYLYLRTLSRLEPSYPGIDAEKEKVKEEVRKRSMRSLAIIPFKGTSYNADAGSLVTSSALDLMYKELSKEIRILERGAIEALLKESEVKTIQAGEGTKGLIHLLGADYLLLGDVVNYRVEPNSSETNKTTRVKVGVKKAANPAFDEWVRRGKEGTAPPATVYEDEMERITYKITHLKKTAIVTVSYRIVDSKGDWIYSDLAEKKLDVEDEATDGIEIGDFKVAPKVAKIPSDTELLRSAQAIVVTSIGDGIKKIFGNPEEKLLAEVEALSKRSSFRAAAEKAVDMRFVAERKGMDTGVVDARIDALIKDGKM